ncbi:MAG: hypothetical protein H8E38_12900 [SAR324 cluster bacterium]|nr:hypothetical protein [SAR324 cluster bacterium]
MIAPLSAVPCGILGLGFLGKILAKELSKVPESWGTDHKTPAPELELPVFYFDWNKQDSWSSLPETSAVLALTIPPQLDSPEAEAKRLHNWCSWMQQERPSLKRMIYISSTGVYPKRNGLWSEDSEFEADTNSGKLRLLTEKILSQYFTLHVVRPGGIYGCGRGIDVRFKSGKPIPVSTTPVHRIHVEDLSRIILHLAEHPESPSCINAVDLEAKPSWEVACWLAENREDLTEEMLQFPLNDINLLQAVKPEETPERFVSNQRLHELDITLHYPTFREGLG